MFVPTVLLLLLSGALSQHFLPTEYSPNEAIVYDINQRNYNMQMQLCNINDYQGCLFEAYLNIPFQDWSIPNGVYVQYSVVGGINCNQVFCSNNINTNTPQNCSFYLPGNITNSLYLVSQAGNTVALTATFSLKINCAVTGKSTFSKYSDGCPVQPDQSRQNVRLSSPGSVLTSSTNPANYSFIVCPTHSSFTSFSYILEATDQNSAFASYFCPSLPCDANNSPDGWYDASGSAINNVRVGNLKSMTLYLAVYGWGNYGAENNFVFNIQVSDQSGATRYLKADSIRPLK
jgi:hypothetical protein